MLRKLLSPCAIFKYSNNHFRQKLSSQSHGQQKIVQKMSYGSLSSIAEQRKKTSLQYRNKMKQNQSAVSADLKSFADHQICQVILYMKHNDWRSQYIYSLMNYQQLGFSKVSDYSFLKQIGDFLKINKQPEGQQWPVLKFSAPFQDSQFIVGLKHIISFIDKKNLVRFQVDDDPSLDGTVEKYINQNIVPHLQTIFWHPRLTFQEVFHVNLSSFGRASHNYRIIFIVFKNSFTLISKMTKNLLKILTHKEKYAKSRQNLEKGLKQIINMLGGKQFIGGNQPAHLDFYLFAILNTKMGSRHFEKFLRNDIGGQFWQWFFRMKKLTRYEEERVTIL